MRNAIYVVLLALPIASWGFGQQPAKTAPPAKDSLNSEQIGKLLKEMGHEPKSLSADTWQTTIDRQGWKIHVMVSVAAEGDRIWLESRFATIPDPEVIPASAWLKLLQENERISPAHFAFDKEDKRIHLYRSFDNSGVTSARLKKEIESFDAVVRRTQNIWRSEAFSPAEAIPVMPRTAEEEPKKVSTFDGAWRLIRFEAKGESTTEDRFAPAKLGVVFGRDKVVLNTGLEPEREARVKIDPTQKPKAIDFISGNNRVEKGIYIEEVGLLTICVAAAGEDRPRQFVTDPKNKLWLLVLKRQE